MSISQGQSKLDTSEGFYVPIWLSIFIPALAAFLCYTFQMEKLAFVLSFIALSGFFLSILLSNSQIMRVETFKNLNQKRQTKARRYIKICVYCATSGLILSVSAILLSAITTDWLIKALIFPIMFFIFLSGVSLGLLRLLYTKKP